MEYESVVKMLEKNINYYASYVFRNSGMEFDDAKQEILLRMYKASKKYDEKRSKENTYFITVIKKECSRLIKKTISRGRKEQELFVKDEDCAILFYVMNNGVRQHTKLVDRTINLKVSFEEKLINKCLLDKVESKLEDSHLRILKMLRKGDNLESISKELNWSKQRICNNFRDRIKPKIIENFS